MALKTREEISEIRNTIVLAGKKLPTYIKYAKDNWYKDPRHFEKNNTEKSGAIEDNDAWWLYEYICSHADIQNVFEVGTWFGTSAAIMAMALVDSERSGKVYTCCMDPVYLGKKLPNADRIEYNHREATGMMRKLKKLGIPIQFAFIDGRLDVQDTKLLYNMMSGESFGIAIHDSFKKEKGGRNIDKLLGYMPGFLEVKFVRHVTAPMGLIEILR